MTFNSNKCRDASYHKGLFSQGWLSRGRCKGFLLSPSQMVPTLQSDRQMQHQWTYVELNYYKAAWILFKVKTGSKTSISLSYYLHVCVLHCVRHPRTWCDHGVGPCRQWWSLHKPQTPRTCQPGSPNPSKPTDLTTHTHTVYLGQEQLMLFPCYHHQQGASLIKALNP